MSRTAIVTGASGGIGAAIARALAGDGLSLACVANSNAASASALASEIAETGGHAESFKADVSDEASVRELVDAVAAWAAPPMVLVNAAGVSRDGLAVRYPAEELRRTLDVNLAGAFLACRAVLPAMLRGRWGRIVTVSSVAGLMGNAGQVAYSASKAGLLGLTRSLAKEVGGRGITVNAVCPGVIETAMTAALPSPALDRLVSATPAGRCGRPEEVAAVVRFLVSEDATFVNGAVVPVDGGLSA